MRTYKATAEYTINAIRTLPVVIPDYGTIPGFIFHNTKDADEAIWDDSQHFPMGTSFLKLGVAGVASTAMEKAKSASCDESKELYLAIYDVYTETLSYLKKYPPKLSEMISSAEDPIEKERLNIMLLDINDIISGKPSSFRSAVTLFFIMYRIRNFFRCSTLGRLDVYFREFFENDIALGKITEEGALSIICNLWERINECGSGDTLMNVMVGGSDENGRDNSSRLSVLMLRASIMIPKSEPHINVRYHKGIRGDVMEEAYKLQATGRGQASIYNDDVIIPSLINHGIELKYACQYTNDGCTEIVFDGLSKIDFNHADIVAILDLTLNNGKFTPKNNIRIKYYCEASNPRESLPDAVPGIESGNIDDSTSFDEVYEAFLKQYKAQLEILMDAMNEKCHKYGTFPSVCGNPFLNGTFMSVLESGKNMYGGGLPTAT